MQYPSLDKVLSNKARALAKGPVALVFIEDEVEVNSTLRHHLDTGFDPVVALMPASFKLAADVERAVLRVTHDTSRRDDCIATVNKVIAAAPGLWLYYCFNAEYLFYPFCENRRIGEMLQFHAEERREAMLAYVVDLYAGDLDRFPDAVSLEDAHLDKSGYYALSRDDPANPGQSKARQLDFYGGLRWRYEEHIPPERRKIDRIALFRAKPGLSLRADHTFNDEEMNTYACPWHHNLTAAIVSFRAAKALKSNPGSTFDIHNFRCHTSTRFEWHSRQLLDLGLMEPGQWF
ncbi:MAG: hypothetical protein AAF922_04210 [Pseudomonadota bacterium]